MERTGILPYWNHDVELDVVSWLPYSFDPHPVSVHAMHSEELRSIAAMALELGSELLYLNSLGSGQVGSLFPDRLIDPGRHEDAEAGFAMIFGYSRPMEMLTCLLSSSMPGLKAGLALCGLWDRHMLLDEMKVIAFASQNIFFEEGPFLTMLRDVLSKAAGEQQRCAFYAEKFGYRRATIPFETDDMTQMAITQTLFDFEMEETRQVVGPAPEITWEDPWSPSLGGVSL